MRKTFLALVVAALAVGCTSRTEFGECIGITEERDPALTYKVSAWNVVLGILFMESIVVPVWVALEEHSCPNGRKGVTQ